MLTPADPLVGVTARKKKTENSFYNALAHLELEVKKERKTACIFQTFNKIVFYYKVLSLKPKSLPMNISYLIYSLFYVLVLFGITILRNT